MIISIGRHDLSVWGFDCGLVDRQFGEGSCKAGRDFTVRSLNRKCLCVREKFLLEGSSRDVTFTSRLCLFTNSFIEVFNTGSEMGTSRLKM